MNVPFDLTFREIMAELAMILAKETGARCAYTQSDEITLLWQQEGYSQQIWFSGRVQKMVSQLGAWASVEFYKLVESRSPSWLTDRATPTFDARVFNVPNMVEAVNVFVWRESDAARNSVTQAASAYFSHNELHRKSSREKQEMLHSRGVNWNDYPDEFKRGVYVLRKQELRGFTDEEKRRLPEGADKDGEFVRRFYEAVTLPRIASIVNRERVLFFGDDPECQEQLLGGG